MHDAVVIPHQQGFALWACGQAMQGAPACSGAQVTCGGSSAPPHGCTDNRAIIRAVCRAVTPSRSPVLLAGRMPAQGVEVDELVLRACKPNMTPAQLIAPHARLQPLRHLCHGSKHPAPPRPCWRRRLSRPTCLAVKGLQAATDAGGRKPHAVLRPGQGSHLQDDGVVDHVGRALVHLRACSLACSSP